MKQNLVFVFQATHLRSNPISIGNQAFGRIPRRQNSNEALNKEIEFISNSSATGEPRVSNIFFNY